MFRYQAPGSACYLCAGGARLEPSPSGGYTRWLSACSTWWCCVPAALNIMGRIVAGRCPATRGRLSWCVTLPGVKMEVGRIRRANCSTCGRSRRALRQAWFFRQKHRQRDNLAGALEKKDDERPGKVNYESLNLASICRRTGPTSAAFSCCACDGPRGTTCSASANGRRQAARWRRRTRGITEAGGGQSRRHYCRFPIARISACCW